MMSKIDIEVNVLLEIDSQDFFPLHSPRVKPTAMRAVLAEVRAGHRLVVRGVVELLLAAMPGLYF